MIWKICKKSTLVVLLLVFTTSLSQANITDIPFFQGTLAQLEAQAQHSRTPYFIYFYVSECDECRRMQKETFNYGPLASFVEKNFLAYQVDGLGSSTGRAIRHRYNVKKMPTLIVLGPENPNSFRHRQDGFISGPQMLSILQKAVKASDRNLSNRVISTVSQPNTTPSESGTSDAPSWDSNIVNRNTDSNYPDYNSSPSIVSTNGESTSRGNQTGMRESNAYPNSSDKQAYMERYFSNRGEARAGYRGASQATAAATYNPEDYNYSFIDEQLQPAYEASSGNSQAGYRASTSSNSGLTQTDPFGNYSWVDDAVRTDPSILTRSQSQSNARFNPPQNPPQKVPSFLDHMSQSSHASHGQRTASTGNQNSLNLSNLPNGTMLYRTQDGSWSVTKPSNTASASSAGQRTRGQEAPAQPKVVTREVSRSVPGLSNYSPKDIVNNTFSLVIGSFSSLGELKTEMAEFKQHNNSRLWVYSEKINNRRFFKLAMGEYGGEQEAVSDAIRMGASWDAIEVVNLAKLN